MKYYYEKPDEWLSAGKIYICDHPLYNRCTLFQNESKGVAIIQEYFDPNKKARWWSSIKPWIAGDIFFHEKFQEFFNDNAQEADANGLYPTFTVRTVMWALRMKPLKREYWENT